jgi:hypothetical protein
LLIVVVAAAVVAFAVALNCLKGVFLGFGCCFVCLFFFFFVGFLEERLEGAWRELGGS